LTYVLVTLLAVQTVVLVAAGYFAVKFGLTILKAQDSIEECLDVLDKRYESISKVLQIPLFYDSPEIKKVHEDIKASRDAILYVANVISRVEEEEAEKDDR
jgi:hypothetical protein